MKRIAFLLALQVFVLPLFAAEPPKECALCAGAVSDLQVAPAAPLPLLVKLRQDDFATAGAALDAMPPAVRAKVTVIVSYAAESGKDPMAEVEAHTQAIVDWAKQHGPFEGLGVDVANVDATVGGYAIKRLAVTAQGQNAAARIVLGVESGVWGVEATTPSSSPSNSQLPTPHSLDQLFETGAQAYVDVLLSDAANVKSTAAWILEKDPAKKIWAIVNPQSPNVFFDVSRALADGATRGYVNAPATAELLASLASFDRALIGEYAYDATARIDMLDAKGNKIDEPVIAFVRGEDLRTVLVPRGDAAASTIASPAGDYYKTPRRYDAAGDKDVTDVGTKGGRFLIGMPPVKQPFVFTVEHNDAPRANVTKEAMNISGQRGITVEEIIRNHQAYKSYQESIQPRYVARDATKLRFTMTGGEAIEATIAGDYFSDPTSKPTPRADWVWQDFYLNGVKWKYGKIPELPLIQPEKVTQLPLDIHLTNEYRYELVRESDLLGYHTYEVRFQPPPNAAADLPLYRGTVWIDSKTWARVRLSMVQLNLKGEILSNEERVDFQPFAKSTHAPLTASDVAKTDAREIIWLPQTVSAQQVVSAAGHGTVVLRQTDFTNFRIEPADYEMSLAEAEKSDARMVRETKTGLRYLERTKSGERVVQEGFHSARTFLLGGIHHDAGLQYPVVPLGGIDYFNFDLFHKGIQANVFFAGVVIAANATNPNVANTRTNVGVDFFGIAVPTTQSMYRNGQEQLGEEVKQLPTRFSIRAGHPFLQFGKVDFTLGFEHDTYMRSDNTASSFAVPADTFVISPGIDAQYARWGATITGFYDYNTRTKWQPWGNLAEYDPKQKTFTDFGGSLAKSFYLPKFQRIGVEIDYMDGTRLDRFSQYGFGFFGAQRIHGIKSGSLLADRAILGHLSYGFVFSEQFRLEAFYDHGLIDNKLAGYQREPFQGLGIAGQTVGPYGTLLRLDIGKTIGRNAQTGFVADVVFLKLF
ncbi:MAG TPA: hypothetical protein VGQ65_01195 [Thermoanaerobaculia bacterium]|jgi:hypothetical protein|nr:hypothetical protein [Thermoanaerobaculia bacterium]